MTDKEIRAMPPGQSLDDLVALHVMGPHGVKTIPFHPSITWSDSFSVVEKMTQDGLDFECRTLHSGRWRAVFWDSHGMEPMVCDNVGYVIHDPTEPWDWPVTCLSLPEAICKSALLYALRPKPEANQDEIQTTIESVPFLADPKWDD